MSRAYSCACSCQDCKSIHYNGEPGVRTLLFGGVRYRRGRAHCGRAFKGCLA